jgi:hypothetical protein
MAQWNPFEDLATLRQEIDRAFEGFGGQDPVRQVAFLPGRSPRRYPLIGLVNFFRHFELNERVDQSKISAALNHGVLTLNLPKAEEAKPRKIDVKVAF